MKLLHLVIGVGTVAALASCAKGFDAPSSYEEIQKESYKSSFEKKYGTISPNQKWDFSTYEFRLGTTRGASAINTEIMEKGVDFGDVSKLKLKEVKFPRNPEWDYVEIEGGVEKNSALFDAMKKALPEQKSWAGQPAVLVAPSSSFYIYPIFSGGNLRYDLKVKVGNEDPVTVFQKDYKNFQTINGMKKDNGGIVNMKGIKIEAPVGTPVEVYLDNRIRLNDDKLQDVAGTTNGQAVYVNIPDNIIPELDGVELKDNAVAKYIGIEDILKSDSKNDEKTDNDYNDMVLAVVGNGQMGIAALTYYVLVYIVANMAVFTVINVVERNNGGRTDMAAYNGFYQTNPKLSFLLTLALFSLAGIPPFAGMFSKFFVFMAAAQQGSAAAYFVVFVALVNTVVSLYYYLLIVKAMYITKTDSPLPTFQSDVNTKIAMAICTAGVALFGVCSCIYEWIAAAGM